MPLPASVLVLVYPHDASIAAQVIGIAFAAVALFTQAMRTL
jgi:hypothetical protein